MKLKYGIYLVLTIMISGMGAVFLHQTQESYISESIENIQMANVDTSIITETLNTAQTYIKGEDIRRPSKGEAYAIIRVNRVGFEKNLFMGDATEQLDAGIGQFYYSGLPGEGRPLLLAGHNGTQFYKLREFQEGDLVEITTDYGTYSYKITNMEIQNADDFDEGKLNENKETLIMYTCYPFNVINTPQRYFVYAEFVSGPKIVGNIA